MAQPLHEESLGDGLRYAEEPLEKPRRFPGRRCVLLRDGVEGHVSSCVLVEYRQRFGSVALPVLGFAGVMTPPEHRRRGYALQMLRTAIRRAAERADVLLLYGIEGLYPKVGFAACAYDCEIRVSVRDAMRRAWGGLPVRPFRAEDLPAMCECYNREHACRPWTAVHEKATYRGAAPQEDWSPGEECVVVERDGEMLGYVVCSASRFGAPRTPSVSEICAAGPETAFGLIGHVIQRAAALHLDTVSFHEPPDSTAGRALRRIGCEVVTRAAADSFGMGLIVNRRQFLEALRPELLRRAGVDHAAAFAALAEGRIYPDSTTLLPLITGFHSWRDAADTGHALPTGFEDACRAWFPGPGDTLPVAYAHLCDRY